MTAAPSHHSPPPTPNIPHVPPLVGSLDLSNKDNPEESAWYAYCNNFDKSEWDCFFSKQHIYSM